MFTLETTDIWSNLFAAGAQVSIISDLFRQISFLLDSAIYALVPVVFDLIYKLYDINTIMKDSNEIIATTSKSLYSLLAIYMFFSVSFSLLGMLVDPNMIENKDKGAGKIVSNIVVCIVLLVMVPYIFDFASMAQAKIMEDQLIEKAIYGENFNKDGNYTLGNRLTLSTWGIFLKPTTDKGDAVKAYDAIFNDSSGKANFWYKIGLATSLNRTTWGIFGFVLKIPGVGAALRAFGSESRYQLSYIIFISTAAGIYLLWSMVKLCIDVAYRSLKMFALQILAPIAIMSFLNPKSSKDGIFAKWAKEVVKTYTSLFVRIFIFAFASLLAMELDISQTGSEGGTTTLLGYISVRLMYIMAIVAFIKSAPKFIDGILGTELAKESETKFAHNLLKGGLAWGAAATTNAIGTISSGKIAGASKRDMFKKVLANSGSAGKTAFDSAKKNDFRGVISAFNPDKNDLGKTRKEWKIPTKEEERQRQRAVDLSDAVVAAKKRYVAPSADGYKAGIEDQFDNTDPTKGFLNKFGYKGLREKPEHERLRFFFDKREKGAYTASVLAADGMSSDGTSRYLESVDADYRSNVAQLGLKEAQNAQSTLEMKLTNADSASEAAIRAFGATDITDYKNQLQVMVNNAKVDVSRAENDAGKYDNEAKGKKSALKTYLASRDGLADSKVYDRWKQGDYYTGEDSESK